MNFNRGISSASNLSEVYTSFRGPMKSFSLVQSINREKGLLRRWIVFSQGKRSTLVRFLFGKWLWDELNSIEQEVFWSLREVTDDKTIFLSLKAKKLGVSKRDIRDRLKNSPFDELNFISRQSYLTLKGRVNWILKEETISLRKVPKYSGYTKNHRDHGSLGSERDYVSEVFDPVIEISDEILLRYLSVGEVSLFGGVGIFSLKRPNKVETDKSK